MPCRVRNKYSTPLWAITLLGSLFIWVLSLTMVLTVYSRFFKLYMATAIAPIPLASFAGQPSSNIGIAFLKTYAGICLEGCIIVLACVIFSAFASTPPAVAGDDVAAATVVWNYVGELIFNMREATRCRTNSTWEMSCNEVKPTEKLCFSN